MCYPDWDDAVVGRWGGYAGLTCHLLLIKMRGILRISFSTRAARDNLVMILDTIADESATFVDQDTRFPVEYMIPTSSGPIATLLGQMHSAASWLPESDNDTNRSNVEMSFRKALERVIKVLSNPYGDIARAHLIYNRDEFESAYGLNWLKEVK